MIEQTGNGKLIDVIHDEVDANGGSISFARFMELALYHPGYGYYLGTERKPGRGGDFITAPEASAYFGITLARQMAECWERLGRPERWTIREYGAGHGGLAYDIIAGLTEDHPDAAAGLRYRLIEPNAHLLAGAMASMAEVGLDGMVSPETPGPGGEVEPITGVVIANEVADALPVRRYLAQDGDVFERRVGWRDGRFVDVVAALDPESAAAVAKLEAAGIRFRDGDAFEIGFAAPAWFASACNGLERGYLLAIDYGYPVDKLYSGHLLRGTVRGYYEHTVTDDPYQRVGEQDLTAHVDFSALIEAGERAGTLLAGVTTQGALLASLGLGQRIVDLQQDSEATTADIMAARAVVLRLIDPGGLGRFGVLIMAKNAPIDPPLISFSEKPPAF